MDSAELIYEETLQPRATFDHLLVTVDQRVDAARNAVEPAS